jgi:hypothetical protein
MRQVYTVLNYAPLESSKSSLSNPRNRPSRILEITPLESSKSPPSNPRCHPSQILETTFDTIPLPSNIPFTLKDILAQFVPLENVVFEPLKLEPQRARQTLLLPTFTISSHPFNYFTLFFTYNLLN